MLIPREMFRHLRYIKEDVRSEYTKFYFVDSENVTDEYRRALRDCDKMHYDIRECHLVVNYEDILGKK